jgi:Putative DNA-binding domain
VPTLLEVQNAMRKSLVDRSDGEAAAMLAEHVPADRLDIYRNTFIMGLTKALRVSFPAVHRLVGDDFFAAAADLFIAASPPQAAYLDAYGADFPEFLEQFPPAATLAYLPDVARLEWAVNRAIHGCDREPLKLTELAALTPQDHGRVCFAPHPSIGLLRLSYPADVIWRAVLDCDDAALAALNLHPAPVQLLVQRLPTGVEIVRLDESEWRFATALCAGQPLQTALDEATGIDTTALLARHLAAERFVGFTLVGHEASAMPDDRPGRTVQ